MFTVRGCSDHWVYTTVYFSVDRSPSSLASNSTASAKVIYPDTSQMAIYDPRQKPGMLIFYCSLSTILFTSITYTVACVRPGNTLVILKKKNY